MPPVAQALVVTGTVGVGKTSVAEAVSDLLTADGVPHAVIDLDWLCHAWPPPPEDRFNSALGLRNLAAVARAYVGAGAVRLVVAGVLETPAEAGPVPRGARPPLAVCLLRADLPVVHARLTRRHEGDDAGLRWHLARSGELAEILDASGVEDHRVDASSTVVGAAERVLEVAGWR